VTMTMADMGRSIWLAPSTLAPSRRPHRRRFVLTYLGTPLIAPCPRRARLRTHGLPEGRSLAALAVGVVLAVHAAVPPLRAPQPVAALPSVEEVVERVTVQDVAAAPEDGLRRPCRPRVRPGGRKLAPMSPEMPSACGVGGRAAISAAPAVEPVVAGSADKKPLPRAPENAIDAPPAGHPVASSQATHEVASSTGSDDVGSVGSDDDVVARGAGHDGAGGGGSIGRALPAAGGRYDQVLDPPRRSGPVRRAPRCRPTRPPSRQLVTATVPRRRRDACARRLTERLPARSRPLEARGAITPGRATGSQEPPPARAGALRTLRRGPLDLD
jgi:hypothetical protein